VDEWDALGPGMKIDRRSTDWGIVSLVIGAAFLVMAPVMLTFNMLYWVHAVHRHTQQEIELNRLFTVLIGGLFLALISFGIFAAFRSMSLARASSQPTALGVGGLLTCGLDALLWLGLGIDLLAVLNTFL
jgi:hypothetical protein